MIYTMIYGTLSKGEDGLYHVKAATDEKKRCYVQVKNALVTEDADDEITFDLSNAVGVEKVEDIHANNITAANENSVTWFGKQLPEKTITKVYTKQDTLSADKISATKVFSANKELLTEVPSLVGSKCSIMLEYAGLWFAKKAFGPQWNLVQVKLLPEPAPEPVPEPEPEPTPEPEPEVEAYPDEIVIEDDE
jgi:hypothetical protein